MKVFDLYAKYYDLMYRDKNYVKETEYIIRFINKFNPGAQTILDLGCGTGKHDIVLSEKGFDTTGVELSSKMHRSAEKLLKVNADKELSLRFLKGDIRTVRLKKKFDVIISLFHVINYQTTNNCLASVFETVKKHLNKGGVFIFDFWYGPAVLTDRPLKKTRVLEEGNIKIKRYTVPELKVNENLAVINFLIEMRDNKTGQTDKFRETHNMRYLFLPELDGLSENYKLKRVHTEEWMTGKSLTDKSWYGLAVLKNQN